MKPDDLDAALIRAHAEGETAHLATLYQRAAALARDNKDHDACCFFLTQAYVCALASGAETADMLHAQLVQYGREE